ncbi:MAG TPA: hypothetical protein VFZ09_20810 [Archangium sp.]|uniref:hypothetical protein n=1 Tax=Archangium sp. TaxID=1872627 RepID=UPI002E33D846|nr:hypothetical protein [Archangium sp.]HEX5748694.1 hypothetical protein [Archangium sp.]
MKRLMAIAALALAQAGCVANQGDAAVRFLDARALTFEEGVGCTPADDFVIGSGLLDLSGSLNYLLAMSVETNNSVQSITVNQEEFSGQGLSDITLNEIVYSYKFMPQGGTDATNLIDTEEETSAIYRVLRPGTSAEESYVFMNAFGPKAVAALPGKGAGTVFATIKARGRLSSGQTVESNKFTFPVTVYTSGATYDCTDPDTKPAGTCVRGQDVLVPSGSNGCVDAT